MRVVSSGEVIKDIRFTVLARQRLESFPRRLVGRNQLQHASKHLIAITPVQGNPAKYTRVEGK